MSVLSIPQVQQLLRTSQAITVTMGSKRVASKENTERNTGEAVEQTSVDFPVYVDTQLFIENGSSLTWQHIKDYFPKDFEADLKDDRFISVPGSRGYTRLHASIPPSHVHISLVGLFHTLIRRP